MSTSVDNQTRQMTDHYSTAQATKRGQAEIAQSHRVVGKPAIDTDVVVPAASACKQALNLARLSTDGQPSLPRPSGASKIYQGASQGDESLLALMGAILLLQGKKDSNFWSDMWKMATMSMRMQTELAPLAGKAVQAQFTAQSIATLTDSELKSANGMTIGMGAGGSLAKEAYTAYTEPKSASKDPAIEYGEENPDEANSLSTRENQTLEKNDSWDFGKAWECTKSKAALAGKWAYDTVDGASDAAKKASGFTKIIVDVTDAKFHDQQQSFQGIQRMAASTGQSIQVFSGFFGQNFSKMEEFRQGCGQNLTSAMNLLQQATNSISQSATSMFRG